MTLPNKKRGFRKIIVENKEFQWKFSKHIDVRLSNQKNIKLIVDINWFDEWLYVNDSKDKPPKFEPKVVTPNFVQKAIKFALTNGWNLNQKSEKFSIMYRNNKFQIQK